MLLRDQLNREIKLKGIPKRIVSLVPSQTELLIDLGLENKLVGVTKFCVHPKHLRSSKTIVGGTKQINIDKIKALNPDVILCNKEENTKEIINALESVAPIHISDIYTIEDTIELISMYGNLFQCQFKAQEVIQYINLEKEKYQEFKPKEANVKIAYFIWKNPWMVAASNTFIDTMMLEAGFKNVFGGKERYPEIDLKDKLLGDAELLFLSSEPYPFKTKHIKELQQIYPNKKIVIVDGELFSWYGSRICKSFTYFKSLQKDLGLLMP